MGYDTFERDLYRVYESEVLGEAMFNLISRLTFNADHKRKWEALTQLETQTLARYLKFVADKPALKDRREPSRFKGYVFGLVFSLLAWSVAMKLLSDSTAPFLRASGQSGSL